MLAAFITWTTYGFWLPNDERGSGSRKVWADHLKPFGEATQVDTTHSVAHHPFDPVIRKHARESLKYPHVILSGRQAKSVASAISNYCAKLNHTIYAFAIMPDHLHMVLDPRGCDPHEITATLKRSATSRLNKEDLHPLADFKDSRDRVPTPWADGRWIVYLDTAEQMQQRIAYVNQNPIKAGLPTQSWSFVRPFR